MAVLNSRADEAFWYRFERAQRGVVRGSDVLEHVIALTPCDEVSHGGGAQAARIIQAHIPDEDKTVGVFVRQRFQH